MFSTLKQKLLCAITTEQSSSRLALAFCIGNYIAFSPFIGFHGLMAIVFSWLSGLNFAIMFAAAYGINNLATAIPIYGADYFFGYWLTHTILHADLNFLNPWWLINFHIFCQNKIGIPLPCMWSFLIGGNVLGIITSIALYPLCKYMFDTLKAPKTTELKESNT